MSSQLLVLQKEFQFGFLNVYKNAFDIRILRKIYV